VDYPSILDWIVRHPDVAGGVVFLVSLAESLVVVGLFIPGTVVMFAIGAVVAAGGLEIWATLAWAATGAITGDGVSYWLGRHYREQLPTWWPFRRHPQWIARGKAFFHSHGGKSVLLGRFVGPVRPIIPAIAGMLGMPALRFYAVNVLSALAWAPAYILPGVVFGASLQLASAVATRLAVVVAVLLLTIWGGIWATRKAVLGLQPRIDVRLARLQTWASAPAIHRGVWLRRLLSSLLDPARPEFRALAAFAAVLVLAAWGLFAVLEDVVSRDRLVLIDSTVYHLLQGLRTPFGDSVLVALTELGDTWVLLTVVMVVLAWLLWQRAFRPAAYWAAAAGVGAALTTAIKAGVGRERPVALAEVASGFSFPSGHATNSVVIYGLLALLIARGLSPRARIAAWATFVVLVALIALSRLYLGAHWLSDVMGGVAFGTAWITLIGIAYLRHPSPALSARGLAVVALSALLVSGGWRIVTEHDNDLARYAARHQAKTLTQREWWAGAWQTLPAWRIDLEGDYEQPLTVQWAGSLDTLRRQLLARGWQEPLPPGGRNLLLWLDTTRTAMQMPALPRVHDGRYEALALIRPAEDHEDQRDVLRLWAADTVLAETRQTIWVGTVARETIRRRLSSFNLPQDGEDFNRPRTILVESLSGVNLQVAQRVGWSRLQDQQIVWDGVLVLAREPDVP
jgi:undecaprenyl-diphosphatase